MGALAVSADSAQRLGAARSRKVAFPASSASHLWFQEEEPDPTAEAKSNFSSWLQEVAKNEKMFEEHVYKNPHLSELDLHQHRARVFWLLAEGERLIVQFLKLGYAKKIEPAPFFQLIEEQLESLLVAFNAWHGPLDAQEDIPEDFKQGVRDIEAGKVVDLDTALTAVPNGADV